MYYSIWSYAVLDGLAALNADPEDPTEWRVVFEATSDEEAFDIIDVMNDDAGSCWSDEVTLYDEESLEYADGPDKDYVDLKAEADELRRLSLAR